MPDIVVSRPNRYLPLLFLSLFLTYALIPGCSSGSDSSPQGTAPPTTSPPNGGGGILVSLPYIDGDVRQMVSDGGGGIYMCGAFTHIGTIERRYLAHILANGVLDPWNPITGMNGGVDALLLTPETVYFGGNFLDINGEARAGLAAVDRVTGALRPWKANAWYAGEGGNFLGDIRAFASSGSVIYVGGGFENIGGELQQAIVGGVPRSGLAALDPITGQPTAFNRAGRHNVYALAISSSSLYAGGSFSDPLHPLGFGLAAFDLTTGAMTLWDPGVNGRVESNALVESMAISGNTIYIGGAFTQAGGQSRQNLAAIDRTSGLATDLRLDTSRQQIDPALRGRVHAVYDDGKTLYVGGDFDTIGGLARNAIAAVDKSTGQITPWNPNLGGESVVVRHIFAQGGKVFIAGFVLPGQEPFHYLVVVDAVTGAVAPDER
jgi:trimeric autotransporter adhesin